MSKSIPAAAILLAAATATPAAANDSQAEIGIGGVVLTRSDDIRMDREELSISRERVKVDYVFTNTSARDIDTVVAFPLPDVENGPITAAPDYVKDLGFRTTVDGVPLDYELRQSARFQGRDVTARLSGLGLPVMPVAEVFDAAVNQLPPDQRKALERDKLIEEAGTDGKQALWSAFWTTSTSVTRRQVFPAARSIAVSHSYKPFAGGSVGGRFDAAYRRDPDFLAMRAKFCIDDDFLTAMDRRMAAAKKTGELYSEQWISYVLTSGANWKGPIRDFRMVIDKGKPTALVSFCGTGVKKIDATRFEVVYRDFVPMRDVSVLIVEFWPAQQ